MGRSCACSAVVCRFEGPEARELSILCRPVAGPDTSPQAEAVYRGLIDELGAEGASLRDLVWEAIFVRDVDRDAPLVLAARERVFGETGLLDQAPAPSLIGQAPVDQGVAFEVCAAAVSPSGSEQSSVRDVRATASCACDGCARTGGRLVGLGGQVSLHTTNVYGTGRSAFEEALDMFHCAARLLEACGMNFRDVVRTWIHVRDIDRDYAALNDARREFFARCGVDPRPASTGVQGVPLPDTHDFSLRLQALTCAGGTDVTPISCPSLNEAWSYGADFSRGLRVVEANGVTLHISGTASIDEAGRTVHMGDLGAQMDRMFDNIESLLAQHGAGFQDVRSGIVYLKHRDDAARLRSACRARGFEGFACALVEAPLCRPELLCEAEVVAALPLRSREA